MNYSKNSSEYIDIEFFQTLQDKLSVEFGIASIITDTKGTPLTKQSNFSEFCSKYIRNTKDGLKKCMECDSYGGKKALELKKPIIYKCHAGLIDFASPIIIKDKIVGCFLCGQILDKKPKIDDFIPIAKKLKLNEEEFKNSLNKVKVIPYEKIEYTATFLYELSSRLSKFSDYQDTSIKTSSLCTNNIEKLNTFLAENSLTTNPIFDSLGFFKKLKFMFFKNIVSNERYIPNINEKIDSASKEIKNISERIKSTEKHYSDFDIKDIKKHI